MPNVIEMRKRWTYHWLCVETGITGCAVMQTPLTRHDFLLRLQHWNEWADGKYIFTEEPGGSHEQSFPTETHGGT